MRSNNTFLALVASFCLSAVAYQSAKPVDVPVQELEFDDYVIEGYVDVIEFGEHLVIAQADEADDGDGANIDMMNAHWCDIHPDKCNNKDDDDDEDKGGEEEEGC